MHSQTDTAGRGEEVAVNQADVDQAINYLTPDLAEFLSDLEGVAASLVHAAIQLLPFGSRVLLLETGMATTEYVEDNSLAVGLRLTPLGIAVISRVAESGDHDEIQELAEAAAAIMQAQTGLPEHDGLRGLADPVPASLPVPPALRRVSQNQHR